METRIKRYNLSARKTWKARVAELVDAPDLGSGAERCGGSSPPFRTTRLQAASCVAFVFYGRSVVWVF